MEGLESYLVVGAKIKLGEAYCRSTRQPENAGKVITLVEGILEYDNGLYTENQVAPSEFNEGEFNSIYHMFENDLSGFMDCEVIS